MLFTVPCTPITPAPLPHLSNLSHNRHMQSPFVHFMTPRAAAARRNRSNRSSSHCLALYVTCTISKAISDGCSGCRRRSANRLVGGEGQRTEENQRQGHSRVRDARSGRALRCGVALKAVCCECTTPLAETGFLPSKRQLPLRGNGACQGSCCGRRGVGDFHGRQRDMVHGHRTGQPCTHKTR